ncbi:hypothetical protein J2Z40_003579 [Cytobacillus eiseniae]|uniref:Uncharacterized protein n=1 Tax=Cytobacillus eiseniae TaxID=762947 RepID=A0ABS4RJD1_9BACI|nr:hypothetical protein [Cytobacillus eiseniae]
MKEIDLVKSLAGGEMMNKSEKELAPSVHHASDDGQKRK